MALMSKSQFAKEMKTAPGAVTNWINRGHIVKGVVEAPHPKTGIVRMMIDSDVAKAELQQNLRFGLQTADVGGDDNPDAYKKAKTELAQAQAEKMQMDLDVKRGALVPMDQVLDQVFSLFRGFRDGLLREVPKWADEFAGIHDHAKLQKIIKDRIERSLSELSHGLPGA